MDRADFHGLASVLPLQAARIPDTVAVMFEGVPLSYAALADQVDGVAARLVERGVVPGNHVGMLARNSDRLLVALLGIVRAGAIATPINWRLMPEEVAYIVGDAGMRLVFTDSASVHALAGLPVETVRLDDDAFVSWLREPMAPPSPPTADDEAVVLQIYTSGTTGRPKGAMLCNRNFEKYVGLDTDLYPRWWGLRRGDVSLIALPLFHIGGVEAVMRVFFSGATMILHREFDPGEVLASIALYRPTIVSLVPTALHMVLNHPDAATTDFSCIRTLIYGASPITLGLLRQAIAAMPADFVQCYGMTEANSSAIGLEPDVHHPDGTPQMRAAGRALPGAEIRTVRPDGTPCNPDEVGEIQVRGRQVMKGYWNNAAATAAAIDADGWLRSGDAGFLDADGYVYIHDRMNDMIISGGENIYPTEVENAVFGHPAVAEVAVIGIPDDKWGEAVVAVVVPKPGAVFDEADIVAWARARIAGFKTPRRIVAIDELPKNAAGKLIKMPLRERFAEVAAS